jgi:hypothetical protein
MKEEQEQNILKKPTEANKSQKSNSMTFEQIVALNNKKLKKIQVNKDYSNDEVNYTAKSAKNREENRETKESIRTV